MTNPVYSALSMNCRLIFPTRSTITISKAETKDQTSKEISLGSSYSLYYRSPAEPVGFSANTDKVLFRVECILFGYIEATHTKCYRVSIHRAVWLCNDSHCDVTIPLFNEEATSLN
jgi:hypothetical protein